MTASPLPKLLIATHNPGKIKEFAAIFDGLAVEYLTLNDAGITEAIPETGDTYAANALLKATAACRATGLLTLADDSGLEVDALGGRPGLYAARYAGPNATNADRWAKLLGELGETQQAGRAARFRCAIALCAPGREPVIVEGVCEGQIAFAPAGTGGFGYDPLFYMPEFGCTMAELDEAIKNQVSHRARAAQKAKAVILEWMQSS
ncbi:MAG: XTP/dITP diphosphatase [Chloroflexi bacterium]|nr:XTP/dITP diphosphatase [Chloroflexota bacterium]